MQLGTSNGNNCTQTPYRVVHKLSLPVPNPWTNLNWKIADTSKDIIIWWAFTVYRTYAYSSCFCHLCVYMIYRYSKKLSTKMSDFWLVIWSCASVQFFYHPDHVENTLLGMQGQEVTTAALIWSLLNEFMQDHKLQLIHHTVVKNKKCK